MVVTVLALARLGLSRLGTLLGLRLCRTLRCGLALVVILRSEEHTSELQSRFDLVCRLRLRPRPGSPLLPYTTLFRSFRPPRPPRRRRRLEDLALPDWLFPPWLLPSWLLPGWDFPDWAPCSV